MTRVTNHAKQRAKERCGINNKSIERIAEKVLKQGITHNECTGQIRRWVDKLYLSEKKANNIRLYGDKAYLFNDNVLITILQIPNDLQNRVKTILKRRKETEDIFKNKNE